MSHKKCIHGTAQPYCIKCHGSQICIHDKRKSRCRQCCGIEICQHNKNKYLCKECGGSGLCKHGREKWHCRDCGGKAFCEHNRRRSLCPECHGSSRCFHGRIRSRCKDCDGSEFCSHGKLKRYCTLCSPKSVYKLYEINAEKRNYVFSLTYEDFLYIIFAPCYYCGKKLAGGIDRIDSDIGYSLQNSRSCCWICNRAKMDTSEYDFKKWILQAAGNITSQESS